MSAFSDFLSALETKLNTSSWVTNPDNNVFYESPDLLSLRDEQYPRLETLIVKAQCAGYADQRHLDWRLQLATAGYLRRDIDATTLVDLQDITNFGVETFNKVHGILDDKQAGTIDVQGLEKFGGYPTIYYEFELFPKVSTFIALTEAHFYLLDTEVL